MEITVSDLGAGLNLRPLCRLCGGAALLLERPFPTPGRERVYFHCPDCDCVFRAEENLLSPEQERTRYQQHQNQRTPEYQAFLERLILPMLEIVRTGRGLDFGCGPVPVLSELLMERGFSMTHYDPIFFPELPSGRFDFITCSETAEHFHAPARDFAKLDSLLAPGGVLALMTQMQPNWDSFFDWYYARDPTHVTFYSPKTMHWVAKAFGWEPRIAEQGVTLFRKPVSPSRDC